MGGVLFAVLLCCKHIFVYAAPVYFIYLLRHFCSEEEEGKEEINCTDAKKKKKENKKGDKGRFQAPPPQKNRVLRPWKLVQMGGGVLSVCVLTFAPFSISDATAWVWS